MAEGGRETTLEKRWEMLRVESKDHLVYLSSPFHAVDVHSHYLCS
jgi:hypothetical protein